MVDVRCACVLDPVGEGGDDRRCDRLVAVLEVERCDRRLEQRRDHVPALDDPGELLGRETCPAASESRSPSCSSRAIAAQLCRETTWERIFASRPSDASG